MVWLIFSSVVFLLIPYNFDYHLKTQKAFLSLSYFLCFPYFLILLFLPLIERKRKNVLEYDNKRRNTTNTLRDADRGERESHVFKADERTWLKSQTLDNESRNLIPAPTWLLVQVRGTQDLLEQAPFSDAVPSAGSPFTDSLSRKRNLINRGGDAPAPWRHPQLS